MKKAIDQRKAGENAASKGTPRGASKDQEGRRAQAQKSSNRETIESVVIAFVLAFLFRTFEAEAFVIPTGSMAPTLMGRHKDVSCQQCGYQFTVGASEEADPWESVCPNCWFRNDIRGCPNFKGDRILVLKPLYNLPHWVPGLPRGPQRWDVMVFKYPEEPQVNYIKRVVGLPGEELRIRYGNLYARRSEDGAFAIAPKSPEKQRVMRMLAFDSNHQPRLWRERGGRARWQAEPPEAWRELDEGRTFECSAPPDDADRWAWLEYHHLAREWDGSEGDLSQTPDRLITDFYGYNTGVGPRPNLHWVGDVSVSLRAEFTDAQGKFRIVLVEAGDRYICQFDLASGDCWLLKHASGHASEKILNRTQGVLRRPGRYRIEFANVDDRLTVWVQDRPIWFKDHPYYDYEGPSLEQDQVPTEEDLRPARIAVQGARVKVSDLVLYRDIYYTHDAREFDDEYSRPFGVHSSQFLSSPETWRKAIGGALATQFGPLGKDDFLVLGDNSPRSKDGRLWLEGARNWVNQIAWEREMTGEEVTEAIARKPGGQVVDAPPHVVRRQLLIGKAFFVYWPHGKPFGPLQFDMQLGRLGTHRFPFYPNVTRMRQIR